MKKIKSVLCCVLSICILFSVSSIPASATEFHSELSAIIEYVSVLFPRICDLTVFDEPLYLGNKLSAYRIGNEGNPVPVDYDMYPVLSGDKVIGFANVINASDDIQVTCSTGLAKELQDYLDYYGNSAFSIIYIEDGVCLIGASGNIVWLQHPSADAQLNCDNVIQSNLSMSAIVPLAAIDSQPMEMDLLYNTLRITNVANTSTDCCPRGICYAACMAMMANYFKNQSYTALQVHDAFGCINTSDYHDLDKECIRYLGMFAGGPYYNSMFNLSNVADCIDANMLLLLDLQHTNASHNVVVYGYAASSDFTNQYFYFMDPNYSGNSISNFPNSGLCYVTTSGYTFSVHCYITAY